MDAEALKTTRDLLGISQAELGALLKLGRNGGRTVRRWEAGDNPIPGPAQVALEALAAGWLPGNSPTSPVRYTEPDIFDVLQDASALIEQSGNKLQLVLRRIQSRDE